MSLSDIENSARHQRHEMAEHIDTQMLALNGISAFHNTKSGPVALLGGGESVKSLDLGAIRAEMPIIGINESWKTLFTPWRVCVDLELQRFHEGETVFFPLAAGSKPPTLPRGVIGVPILHLPRVGEPDFRGFVLDQGTHAYFAGMLALELAVWCGYNPIHLLGYDCRGGYHYDREKRTPGGEKTHAAWRRQLEEADAILARGGVDLRYRLTTNLIWRRWG